MNSILNKRLLPYFYYTGVFFHLIAVLFFVYIQKSNDLTARQVVVKTLSHYGINQAELLDIFSPGQKFLNVPLDGKIKTTHPRIVLPNLSSWDGRGVSPVIDSLVKEHQNQHSYYHSTCGNKNMLPMVVCWLTTNDQKVLLKLSSDMQNFVLNKPSHDTTYSNGWELALAYDLIYPALNDSERRVIEKKIFVALTESLNILDEEFTSLWHGRASHAAIAWICAIVLSDRYNENLITLQQRAQAHFLNAIDGLAYTEIWPNGYNYWIQNRAFLFALASSAYVNGLIDSVNQEKVKQIMKRVGYWNIYATRPDNKIEGFGDEGSRIDLKDETQRVIDLIVQITHDPVLAGYSNYLSRLHKAQAYYSGYQWGILLFNNPSIFSIGDGSLASLGGGLRKAEIFGEKTTNYIYLRSGWSKDDTFISYKAGHSFGHHAHYDAGHFTIYKGAPLATNSSTYNGFFSEHRLDYAIRTIAKNSLLILKSGEKVKPNKYFKTNVSDGGQRLTMPTGSAILSVDDWLRNYHQGKHYEGAELLNFSFKEDEYYYIRSDLTSAYNSLSFDDNGDGGKVKEVVRQLLYLPSEDQVIVFDKVKSTSDYYLKKWVLHSVNKPKIEGLTVLKGALENGIMQSRSDYAEIQNGYGFLKVRRFLPETGVIRLVGGSDYQYYVEDDADEAVLDGKNFRQGAANSPWHDVSMWRLEVQSEAPAEEEYFLVALSPSVNSISVDDVSKVDISGGDAYGLATKESLVIFVKGSGANKFIVNSMGGNVRRLLVLGSNCFGNTVARINGEINGGSKCRDGVVSFYFDKPLLGRVEIGFY